MEILYISHECNASHKWSGRSHCVQVADTRAPLHVTILQTHTRRPNGYEIIILLLLIIFTCSNHKIARLITYIADCYRNDGTWEHGTAMLMAHHLWGSIEQNGRIFTFTNYFPNKTALWPRRHIITNEYLNSITSESNWNMTSTVYGFCQHQLPLIIFMQRNNCHWYPLTNRMHSIHFRVYFIKSDVWNERNHIPPYVFISFLFLGSIESPTMRSKLPSYILAKTICSTLWTIFVAVVFQSNGVYIQTECEMRYNVKQNGDATDDDDEKHTNERIIFNFPWPINVFEKQMTLWRHDTCLLVRLASGDEGARSEEMILLIIIIPLPDVNRKKNRNRSGDRMTKSE